MITISIVSPQKSMDAIDRAIAPVFRRSTRNVPEFWLHPFQHCFPQYLGNAHIYMKNLCPFRAFFY